MANHTARTGNSVLSAEDAKKLGHNGGDNGRNRFTTAVRGLGSILSRASIIINNTPNYPAYKYNNLYINRPQEGRKPWPMDADMERQVIIKNAPWGRGDRYVFDMKSIWPKEYRLVELHIGPFVYRGSDASLLEIATTLADPDSVKFVGYADNLEGVIPLAFYTTGLWMKVVPSKVNREEMEKTMLGDNSLILVSEDMKVYKTVSVMGEESTETKFAILEFVKN